MIVLSLFDGMSCGRIALDRLGIKPTKYFASEIDKHAIKVSKANWDDITHIGDVTKVRHANGVLYTEVGEFQVGKIDIILAGSPCQGFSLAGKQLAFDDDRSKLYFEFERILFECRSGNKDTKFILENVKMREEYREIISERLGCKPVAINSALLSAQNRYRLYWCDLTIPQPTDSKITLDDVLEDVVSEHYYIKGGRLSWLQRFGEVKERNGYVAFNPTKAKCLTVRPEPSWNCTYILQWPRGTNKGGLRCADGKTPSLTTSSWEHNNLLLHEGLVRKLTPVECERLQTVPDNYTAAVSDSQRYKMLGNGWTVDVIVHILKQILEVGK